MRNIDKYVRPCILDLSPYSTARDECEGQPEVFIDANESPYENGFNRYPDPHQKLLKARISEIKGLPVDNIFIGNGSDEAIDLVFRVFCEPGRSNAVAIQPSYGMYSVAAKTNDVELREVSLGEDFSLPVEGLLSACDADTRVMFICSPNNPSGNAFSREDLLDIAERFDGILVVDEAYADFSSEGSLRGMVGSVSNLVVLQTLSKAYGMAGLRLGLAFACPRIIELMSRVKYPYNINVVAQQIALKALEEDASWKIKETLEQRAVLEEALRSISYVEKIYPSDANFLLVKVDDADAVYDYLLSRGIIVRNRTRVPGCRGCLRITVGTPSENARLIDALKSRQ